MDAATPNLIESQWIPGAQLLNINLSWTRDFKALVDGLKSDFDFIRQAKETRSSNLTSLVDLGGLSFTLKRIFSTLQCYILSPDKASDPNVNRSTMDEMDKLCTIYTELAGDVRHETGCPGRYYPFLLYRVTLARLHHSVWVCSRELEDKKDLSHSHRNHAGESYRIAYKCLNHRNHPLDDPMHYSLTLSYATFKRDKEDRTGALQMLEHFTSQFPLLPTGKSRQESLDMTRMFDQLLLEEGM